MLAEIVARQPPSGGSRPVSIGSRSIGVSLQPANSSAGCSPAEPASASPVTDNSSSIPIRRGNQMRCSTSLQGCSQSSVTCLGEPTYGSIRMSFALAQRLVVMPSPLIVSAEPECHLYFARRVTFLSCADNWRRRRPNGRISCLGYRNSLLFLAQGAVLLSFSLPFGLGHSHAGAGGAGARASPGRCELDPENETGG